MFGKTIFTKFYAWYRERYFWHLKKKNVKEIFTDVYRNNEWGGQPGEFYSGDGTHDPSSMEYIRKVAAFIGQRQIKTMLDIGCGDFNIMSKILEQVDVNYTGGDVVEELIRHHQSVYGNERRKFIVLNAIDDGLPDAELVIIRQVLQHLSNAQIVKILGKLSKFRYVLITEHVLLTENVIPNLDKIPGPHIRTRVNSSVFIDKPPFNIAGAKVLFEYRLDEKVKSKMYPAVLRTYLIGHTKS